MARSLNKVQLIGNLTKDVDLRYTPQGVAVCNFSVATNRSWKDSKGEVKEEATVHRVVAWQKLAEICAQILNKGSKVFIEGRVSNRNWDDKEGQRHYVTEVVANDLIVLSGRKKSETSEESASQEPTPPEPKVEPVKEPKPVKKAKPIKE